MSDQSKKGKKVFKTIIAIVLAVFAAVYIISPIDGLPGPVDDILVAAATAILEIGVALLNKKKKELKSGKAAGNIAEDMDVVSEQTPEDK